MLNLSAPRGFIILRPQTVFLSIRGALMLSSSHYHHRDNMSFQTTESGSQVEDNMPFDKQNFYRRPGDDMELRLSNRKSSDFALRNAAGFGDEEYKMFKEVLLKTAREYLDMSKEVEDQDQDQWQAFVNELWDSKLGTIMENYEEQWPLMVYMHKYLRKTSRDRQRKRRAERRAAKMKVLKKDEADKSKEEHTETKHGFDCSAIDDADGLPSFDTKTATKRSEKSGSDRSGTAKGKENVPSDEGHGVGSNKSVPRKSRRRWTPVVEIPVRRKTAKPIPSTPLHIQPPVEAQVGEERAYSQVTASSSSANTHDLVKAFLQSCNPNLGELLPLLIDAEIEDESSLMALVLRDGTDRLPFLMDKFGNKMTPDQILAFNENCELQSQYAA